MNDREKAHQTLIKQVREVGCYIAMNAETLAPNVSEEYVAERGYKLTVEFGTDLIPQIHVERDVWPVYNPKVEVRQ